MAVFRVGLLRTASQQAAPRYHVKQSIRYMASHTSNVTPDQEARIAKEKEEILKLLRDDQKQAEAQRMQTSLGLAGTALYEGASATRSSRIDRWTGQGKPWKELHGQQKGTSRFVLIGMGAALTGVIAYALASELFARNSPTVIYNQACKLIEQSPKVQDYLLKPYTFQTSLTEFSDYSPLNPPSHPTRPSQTVASIHMINPRTGKDTLYLHFFVEGRDKDKPLSYWQIARTNILEGAHWLKERTLDGIDAAKRWWEEQQSEGQNTVVPTAPSKEISQPWWVTRKLRSIVHGVGDLVGSSKDALGISSVDLSSGFRTEPGTWTEGEVHIEMVKDEKGVYQYKRFYLDVPSSASPLSRRIYMDQLPTR